MSRESTRCSAYMTSCCITTITKSVTNHKLIATTFRTLAQRRPKSNNRVDKKTWHHVASLVPPSQVFSVNGYLLYSVNGYLLATAAQPTSFIYPAQQPMSAHFPLSFSRSGRYSIPSSASLSSFSPPSKSSSEPEFSDSSSSSHHLFQSTLMYGCFASDFSKRFHQHFLSFWIEQIMFREPTFVFVLLPSGSIESNSSKVQLKDSPWATAEKLKMP